jgi:menaquinone-9 beta-reductase
MTDAVVIGAGLAGAAVAVRLARAGRDVVLVEREAGPVHKVCGEFLSREAGLYLSALGLDLAALGAVTIDAVRLCSAERSVRVALPFHALSLSRRVLDEALLQRAVQAGVSLRRGVKVDALSHSGSQWSAQLDTGESVAARAAFLACGKHDLRGYKRPAGVQPDLVAFKMHFALAPAQAAELARHVELITFEAGYAGLSLVEGGDANLCLVVRRSRLKALGQRWEYLLAAIEAESSHLRARLAGAQARWPRPLALSAIPYGYLRGDGADELWRLGDQAAVIPSFSGDGMSIALHSAQLAASTYLVGRSADAYQRQLARDVRSQMALASWLSRALVHRTAGVALAAVARVWPSVISTVAFHTRISDAALSRTLQHARASLEA